MFFYTKLRDAVGVKSPKPLAIWTDGADGTDENKCVEYFALMMEDMTADGTMEVHDISGLDPPRMMTADDLRSLFKLTVRIHNEFWEDPRIHQFPISCSGDKFELGTLRATLPILEGCWKQLRVGMAAKCKEFGAAGWGDGIGGWPKCYNQFLPFLDELFADNAAKAGVFLNNLEAAWKNRPLTMAHGDVNP